MNSPRNEQMKPIIMAIGGAAAAAVAAMMLPASFIEGITGATGLSELIPATAAPLGPKARAIISFFAGAVTLMLAMGYLMRRNPDAQPGAQARAQASAQASAANVTYSPYNNDIERGGASLVSKLQQRMSGLKAAGLTFPSMPWAKRHEDDILDLADLPRLRGHDSHPDAPARRPISALTDLSDASLTKRAVPLPSPIMTAVLSEATTAKPTSLFESTVAEIMATPAAVPQTIAVKAIAPVETEAYRAPTVTIPNAIEKEAAAKDDGKHSIQDLLAQLETAIANRLEKIATVENLSAFGKDTYQDLSRGTAPPATQPAAVPVPVPAPALVPAPAPIPAPAALAPVMPRPPLEAVPTPPRSAQDADMDAALNAALETLQRMNARAG